MGVVVSWAWPGALDGVTGQVLERAAALIRSDKWRKNPQAGKWVGLTVIEAMGLDPDDKSDRAKANRVIKAWLAAGSLEEYEDEDTNRVKRTFVRVRDGDE
jgi:hypothetical protein